MINNELLMVRMINRCFYDGGEKIFTKKQLLSYADNDEVAVEKCLVKLKKSGFGRIRTPLSVAGSDDICLEIDGAIPWPLE